MPIAPHGGTLVNRVADASKAQQLADKAKSLVTIPLGEFEQCDLEMLAIGAFSPLTGFMSSADYKSVCQNMHLANGLPWSIPVTLGVSNDIAAKIKPGQQVALTDGASGKLLAVMTVQEIFPRDAKLEIPNVFGTEDTKHPGVANVLAQGQTLLGGPVDVITPSANPEFADFRNGPAKTRETFQQKGWNTVVAFQTRNPIHRAHEYVTKCALEICDGIMIHPLVGMTKSDDIPAETRMACYQTLLNNYYSKDKTFLSVMPAAMRYAGPREAVLHALVRKNYGCTHFIVGRDHAGVGNYYGTYDAQKIFDKFDPAAIGIVPLKFEHSFWCNKCEGMGSTKTCPHDKTNHVTLSGTKVREMLRAGQRPPQEFSRPEVADILIKWAQSLPA